MVLLISPHNKIFTGEDGIHLTRNTNSSVCEYSRKFNFAISHLAWNLMANHLFIVGIFSLSLSHCKTIRANRYLFNQHNAFFVGGKWQFIVVCSTYTYIECGTTVSFYLFIHLCAMCSSECLRAFFFIFDCLIFVYLRMMVVVCFILHCFASTFLCSINPNRLCVCIYTTNVLHSKCGHAKYQKQQKK